MSQQTAAETELAQLLVDSLNLEDVDPASIVVHDAHAADATLAFELSQLTDTQNLSASPIGIFRNVSRPVFDDEARRQVSMPADREAALQRLVSGPDTWTVI